MHFTFHDKNETCAKVFIQDARLQTSGGMERAELLITVLSGDVRETDVVNVPLVTGKHLPREVKGLVKTCTSCSFGESMQEGDRGAVVVPGLPVGEIKLGETTTVVREVVR